MQAKKNKNIQIRTNKDCNQVFFLFTGFGEALLMHPLEFFQKCKLMDRNLVIFRDTNRKFYMNGVGEGIESFRELLNWIDDFLKDSPWISRVFCIGTSSGGAAAVMTGHHCLAEQVWAFSLTLPNSPIFCRRMGQAQLPRLVNPQKFLNKDNSKTEYHIYYNNNTVDAQYASKLKNCRGVKLLPLPGSGHNVMNSIIEGGMLENLLPTYTNETRGDK